MKLVLASKNPGKLREMREILQGLGIEVISETEAGVDVEVVPGITSFCAVADSMKMPLVAWDEDLVVAPVRENSSEDLGRILREHDNVVLMKPSANQQALLQAIRENHLEDHFVLVTKSGTGEERLVTDFAELEQYEIPYLSTVIIKRQGR